MLIGKPCVWNKQYYVLINRYIPLEATSSPFHVTVNPESMASAMKEVSSKYPKELVIGWYHSHPGYGVFLSETDFLTQRLIFKEWFHVALVVDHIRKEYGFFALTDDGGYTRVTHAVWRYVGGAVRAGSYGQRRKT